MDKGLATPDLSLLVDGLRAEREQGITIDVAYRYFATPKRSFVLADTPGHVQYTRNTVTGASTAELAVLLVDARNGVVEQTRRHAAVLALLRVPRVVLAVNKIDLVGYDEAHAHRDRQGLRRARHVARHSPTSTTIPVSALLGDNVVERSAHTPWYDGPTLLDHLESVPVAGPEVNAPFRFPVQYVIRHARHPTTAATRARSRRAPSRPATRSSCCRRGADHRRRGRHRRRPAGRRGRGPQRHDPAGRRHRPLPRRRDRRGRRRRPPSPSELDATLCWLSDKPLRPGARLLVKHGTRTTQAIVGALGERLDTDTVTWVEAPGQLAINDIARVTLRTADPLPVDDYATIRATGSFLLIDPPTGNTLAAGLVGSPLE